MAYKYLDNVGLQHLIASIKRLLAGYATKSELSSHSQNTSNPHEVTASQVGALPLSGGSLTGNLTAPSFQTGTGNANYFQCRKFRGEGDANTYYHAVDFGYAGHNQVDFYEYGGKYVFHRHQDNDAIIGEINGNGFVGKVNGHTINADVPVGAKFTDTTYSNATTSAAGLMSADDKSKLDGIAAGANKYTHPSYTAKSSGLYKVTVDGTGHVSAATAVTKADITALGIPGQDTDTTYSDATTSASGLMSADDKSKLNGIASGATKNVSTAKSFTLSANGWYNADGWDRYIINDSLITTESFQEVIPSGSISKEQYKALQRACLVGTQTQGAMYLWVYGTKPTIDIPIIVVFRGTV